MILYKKPRLRDRAPTRPSEIRARRPRRTSRPYRWLDGVWVAGGCAPDGEGGACDGTPCGEGGASVCAPDGEGGAGGAPCGDWRGQRERRRTPCGEGGASVGAPDGDWRGRRERGGRQCKNRVLRQRSACALFPPLYAIPMRSRVHLRYRTGEPPGAVVHASATMDPMSRKRVILLCSSHNESTP